MAKVSVSTTVRQEVGLDLRTKAQIRTALMEYLDLQREMKLLQAKQDALKALVQTRFNDAEQLDALMEGTDVDGVKIKLVVGSNTKLDKTKLMKKHGLSQADLDACSKTTPSKPYLRVTARGEQEDNE